MDLFTKLQSGMLSVLLFCFTKEIRCQSSSNIDIAVEGSSVYLTFKIPKVDGQLFTTIRLTNSKIADDEDIVIVQDYDFSQPVIVNEFQTLLEATGKTNSREITLHFKQLNASFAGTFACFKQSSSDKLENCGASLTVIRKPEKPVIQVTNGSSLVGNSLTLSCDARSRTLPPDHSLPSIIRWKDEQGRQVGLSFQDGKKFSVNPQDQLVITSITRQDRLRFTCTTEDDGGSQDLRIESDPSELFELTPEYKPDREDIIVYPEVTNNEVVQMTLNSKLQYSCEAECSPECNVKWRFKANESAKASDVNGLADPSVLSFDADLYRPGKYTCLVTNPHGKARTSFTLEVLYINTPQVTYNGNVIESLTVDEGEEMTLTCRVDSVPQPAIIWLSPDDSDLQGTDVEGPEAMEANSGLQQSWYKTSMTLRPQGCEDSGVYTCRGDNTLQQMDKQVEVTVECKPTSPQQYLPLSPTYLYQIPGQLKVEFVVEARPAPTISRLVSRSPDGPSRNESPDFAVATSTYQGKAYLTKFTLTNNRALGVGDDGRTFTMTVDNNNYNADFVFTIQAKGPPHQVSNVTADRISHNALYLSWMPGFNGGEMQTFTILARLMGGAGGVHQRVDNIQDIAGSSGKVTASIGSLRAGSEYEIEVLALNTEGNSSMVAMFVTAAAASAGMDAGAVVGIVFAVIILLIIIGLILFFFVWRKRAGKNINGDSETSKPMLPGPVVKVRDFFKKKTPKPKPADYSDQDDLKKNADEKNSDIESGEDGPTYGNVPVKNTRDPVYANAQVINNNRLRDQKNKEDQVDLKMADEGLLYTTVEFSNSNKKKGKKDKNTDEPESNYSQVDFVKTAELNDQMKRDELDKEKADKSQDEGNESEGAQDGGADLDTGRIYSNELMGTAV